MFYKSIYFLMEHAWLLYLALILHTYEHTARDSSYWIIFIPTMILVILSKVSLRLTLEQKEKEDE